ncbi:hypothetical protein NECAME_16671, partial [Necator americanus]
MWLVAFAVLVLSSVCAEEKSDDNDATPQFEMEEGVYILHDKDFDDFVGENPTFLAKFYAPCEHYVPHD